MSRKLTREDWLDHGLRELGRGGAGRLKADPLARALGVSRGSFYWHFADLAAFHTALLDLWRDRATEAVMRSVAVEGPPDAQLSPLLRRAFRADGRIERAIRSWADDEPLAAAALAAVDRRRIGLLAGMIGGPEAEARAAFVYAAFIGRIMLEGPARPGADAAAALALRLAAYP